MCEIQQRPRKPAEGLSYHVISAISAAPQSRGIVTDILLNNTNFSAAAHQKPGGEL